MGDKELTVPQGADKLAKNTPNAAKNICPSLQVWNFDEKNLQITYKKLLNCIKF